MGFWFDELVKKPLKEVGSSRPAQFTTGLLGAEGLGYATAPFVWSETYKVVDAPFLAVLATIPGLVLALNAAVADFTGRSIVERIYREREPVGYRA